MEKSSQILLLEKENLVSAVCRYRKIFVALFTFLHFAQHLLCEDDFKHALPRYNCKTQHACTPNPT
jgi:hypothetical protein